jgi:group I intron endonuclease
MKCGIYKIYNCINKKIYIGQSEDIERRWQQHKYGKGNKHLRSSFLKYGLINFEFIILEECENDKITLTQREQYYIDLFESYNPQKGYNKNKSAKPNLTKKRDDNFGNKISEIKIKNCHTGKPINQYNLDGTFVKQWLGASQAARELNICSRTILSCCSGRQKQSGGFIWKHVNNDNGIVIPYLKENIIQYDRDGNKIAEYKSIKDIIDRNQDYNFSSISQCVRGETKTSYGFFWLKESIRLSIN